MTNEKIYIPSMGKSYKPKEVAKLILRMLKNQSRTE